MGSVSSKKFPESPSQPDYTRRSTADVLVDSPIETSLCPVSTSPSTVLVNRSGNNLQGLESPETQDFIGTWSGNSPWSLPREVGRATSITSVPPPTNMGRLPDSDTSLWPFFTTDAEWQLDFDDQLTTLPTNAVNGATPNAVNDLALSQSYGQPNQGSESSGLSRGLSEYLNLIHKVSANATILVKSISF